MTQAELFNKLYGGARWDVGVSINRSNSLPLDANSIFASYELAAAYASRDAAQISAACTAAGITKPFLNNAYIGQIIAVVTADEVKVYYIDNNLALQEVGSKMLTDDRTIELSANSELGLHDFGKGYYAYNENAAEGADPYVWTEGFIAGLEPKAKLNTETGKYELAWYQPNPTTVEGLSSEINTLKQTVTGMETSVAKIPTLEAGLANTYTKAEVDAKVAGVLVYKGVASAIATSDPEADEPKNDIIIVGGAEIIASADNVGHVYIIDGKEYASDGSKWEELGSATDLTNYYTKTEVDSVIDADVAALKATLDAVDAGLTDRVTALETNYATKTELNTLSGTVTTLSGKVDDEAAELDALQGTVSTLSGKVDGEVTKLATLTTTVEGHSTSIETLNGEVAKKLNSADFDTYKTDRTATDTELKEYADSLVVTLNSDVGTLKTDVSGLKTDVNSLKTTVGNSESGLVKNVADVTATANKNAADIVTLNTTVGGHTTEIGNIKSDATALAGRVTTAEGNITTLQKIVKGYSTEGSIQAAIEAAHNAANDAQGTADDAVAGVNANAGNITSLDARLTAAEGSITNHGARLTAVEGKVTSLEGQITGLSGAMHFRGISSSDPMGEGGPVLDGAENPVFANGDVVIYSGKEYVYAEGEWHLFGDEGSYALKDSVYTKGEIDATLSTLESNHTAAIAAAKGEAISTAASDATTKANTAEANAKAYVDAALSWADMPALAE